MSLPYCAQSQAVYLRVTRPSGPEKLQVTHPAKRSLKLHGMRLPYSARDELR